MKNKPMETLLHKAFGIKGYRHIETKTDRERITFVLEPSSDPKEVKANPTDYVRHGVRWRNIRSLSIGLQPVYLEVKVQRWRHVQTGAEFEHSPPLPAPIAGSRATSKIASSHSVA
jgi:hypothetical protein